MNASFICIKWLLNKIPNTTYQKITVWCGLIGTNAKDHTLSITKEKFFEMLKVRFPNDRNDERDKAYTSREY